MKTAAVLLAGTIFLSGAALAADDSSRALYIPGSYQKINLPLVEKNFLACMTDGTEMVQESVLGHIVWLRLMRTDICLDGLRAEIDRLAKEAPSAEEIKGIQTYISGIFVIQNSSRSALISQLRYVDFQGLGEDYLKTYVQKVNAITPADVQKQTATYLKPDQMTIVVVGDKSKITEQLTPFYRGAKP